MSAEANLAVLPDQPAPTSARCVGDLVDWMKDNHKAKFIRTLNPAGSEPPFFKVRTMGGYLNNGRPKIELPLEARATPQRRNRPYRPLSSFREIRCEFNGDPDRMADLYSFGGPLFLLSERALRVVMERDPSGIEVCKAEMVGAQSHQIGPHWVVMPTRVLDAVDISKSNVEVERQTVSSGNVVTRVHYYPGYVFREDTPEICSFVDEYRPSWYWHRSLIEAAASRGVRGLLFGYEQVKNITDEVRLRGPNDPLDW